MGNRNVDIIGLLIKAVAYDFGVEKSINIFPMREKREKLKWILFSEKRTEVISKVS